LPRIFAPLARRLIEYSGCPEFPILLRRRRLSFQVTPNPQPFGLTVYASPGCPGSASPAGSMMNPRLYSNFASPGKPADESSCATESDNPCPTLDALLISIRLSTAGKPTMEHQFNLNPASTCLTRTAVQLPTGVFVFIILAFARDVFDFQEVIYCGHNNLLILPGPCARNPAR
jgi:hypothetical protein